MYVPLQPSVLFKKSTRVGSENCSSLREKGVQSKETYRYTGLNRFRFFFSNPSCNKQGAKTVLQILARVLDTELFRKHATVFFARCGISNVDNSTFVQVKPENREIQ